MVSMVDMEPSGFLVEGFAGADVEAYGKWLIEIATVESFYSQLRDDPDLAEMIQRLQVLFLWDFALEAVLLVPGLMAGESVVIETGTHESEIFAVLSQMKFFTWAGDRYRMSLPVPLSLEVVKAAITSLYNTMDLELRLHPENLVSTMSMPELGRLQRLATAQKELDGMEHGAPN
ncbi:MAG: hypothetical protein QOD94_1823 [Alphaproteobacteria bacterium]|jgi:hypothetical protein|nr:hypothetical protein [Alphaproteobacteria bacterium]